MDGKAKKKKEKKENNSKGKENIWTKGDHSLLCMYDLLKVVLGVSMTRLSHTYARWTISKTYIKPERLLRRTPYASSLISPTIKTMFA